ncbi:MAG: mechanosensitive ion channel family protein [Cyanobacteria bacterium P01_H01_bin.74]
MSTLLLPEELPVLIQHATGLTPNLQTKLVGSATIVLIIWVIHLVSRKILRKRLKTPQAVFRWQRIIGYTLAGLGIVLVSRIWFAGIQAIATFLGLFSAGLAFALQAPLVSLAGWAFILWRKPFSLGERIEIGTLRGDVIDQRLFSFTLLELGNWVDADQTTGRMIYIPNGRVFSENICNYSKGFQFIWHEMPVLLTFESNWRKALCLLEGITTTHAMQFSEGAESQIKKAAEKMMLNFKSLSPKVYVSVQDSGVLLTIRILCTPHQRRDLSENIWKAILDEFAGCDDIDFAYPTQRVYYNATEGKSGARAALKNSIEN